MTLNLLLARSPTGGEPVIFDDPSQRSVEPLLPGLMRLADAERLMFPLPHETAHRHVTPPTLMRSRHFDLWNALRADERARVVLVAGPTAGYLARLVGERATTIVAVPEPTAAIPRDWSVWRSVLGPLPELDEVPEEAESPEERARWAERIREATARLDLVRATDFASIADEVARGMGLS